MSTRNNKINIVNLLFVSLVVLIGIIYRMYIIMSAGNNKINIVNLLFVSLVVLIGIIYRIYIIMSNRILGSLATPINYS